MENNANPFLNSDWLSLQQQFIDALSSLNPDQAKTGKSKGAQPGWNEALDQCCKAADKILPGVGRSLFDNILQQTRLFYAITDNFAGLLREMSGSDRHSNDWRVILASHFAEMKAQFDADSIGSKSWNIMSSLFRSSSLDGWEKAVSGMPVFPEDIFNDNIEKLQERLTAVPGIGPTREFQDKIARAIRLWKDYQKKSRQYHSALSQLGKLALDRLEQKIVELAEADKKISSLKQIYNLWIDSNEEVFARFAFKEEHARLYGELVNSLMHYRRQSNEIMDAILSALNMPTGAGMNTVYRRQRQMMHTLRGSIEMQKQMENSFQQLQASLNRINSNSGKSKSRSSSRSAVKKKKPADKRTKSAASKTKVKKKKKPARSL